MAAPEFSPPTGMRAAATPPAINPAAAPSALTLRAVLAAVIGNGLEFYDFSIYSFYAVMISKQFFPAATPGASLLLALATFGVGFVSRPLGSVVLGTYADRVGRKPAL